MSKKVKNNFVGGKKGRGINGHDKRRANATCTLQC